MGDRVWQVQKQLEELQTRGQDTTEVKKTCLTHGFMLYSPGHETSATAVTIERCSLDTLISHRCQKSHVCCHFSPITDGTRGRD